MCGIAGWISRRPISASVLARMGEMLARRGPDGSGVWISEDRCVGLVHRRLAILDLTESGAQPMRRPGVTGVIAHNGEIYNHRELRSGALERGTRFEGDSDTETLLHLLAAKGEGSVSSWEGMFATAFWDESRRRLILARDRFGMKPLYYFERGGEFLFASQPGALLASSVVSAVLDREAAADFLSYGYVPHDRSIFEGIRKLPPARWLVREGERTRIERYWTLSRRAPERPDPEHLRELLESSVAAHTLSDVPVGAFLSGGLDSGSVTGLLASTASAPVETFTIAYPEGGREDLRYAAQCAEYFGTRHHEFQATMPDPVAALEELTEAFDEPIADSTALAVYAMARETARFVKVVLSGDGGDEVFGGYGWHQSSLRYDRWRRRARPLLPLLAMLHRAVALPLARIPSAARLRDGGKVLAGDPVERYFRLRGFMDREERNALFRRPVSDDPAWLFRQAWDPTLAPVHRLLAVDLETYLPDNNLALVDRAAMAHGLEVRIPLLDRPLVEFAFGLPPSLLVDEDRTKILFRRAIGGIVPSEVLARPKYGFSPPFKHWMRGPHRESAYRMIERGELAADGVIRPGVLRTFIDRGHPNRFRKLWATLILEIWYRRWIRGRTVVPEEAEASRAIA